MKEYIRTSGFLRIWAPGASYKIALMRAPHPLYTTLLTHSGALKNPSNRTLMLNGPLIFGHHSRVILTKNHKLSVFFGHHSSMILP